MAFFISRRLTNTLLASSRSSSLCLLSLPSATISKPSSLFCLLHASSSSTQKPQILDPCFLRSAPFSTLKPSKPTFAPSNDNRETRYSGQIPNSIRFSLLENEVRDSLRKSMENIGGLKNALTVLGLVNSGIGAWVVGSLPFDSILLIQGFLASAVPLLLARNLKQCLQTMSSLNMKTEEGMCLICRLAWLAAWRLFVVQLSLMGADMGASCFWPEDLLIIPRINISMATTSLLPLLWGCQMLRMPQELCHLFWWGRLGMFDAMIQSPDWMERRDVWKVPNILLLRLKNASYLAAALSCSWLLCVYLHSYGILTFDVFDM